ncbi:MAG: DUF1572 domain-containing protein [Acidimicrobiia bacterium]|nr:DUF1572 domain-containing protein [Acidimicrobiia bacterium]
MTVPEIRRLFAYNRWANRRLLVAASLLSRDDFSRDLHASFGSVRGTLIHLMWGEGRWLQFWMDGSRAPDPGPDEFATGAELEAAWELIEQQEQVFADSLTEERLARRMKVQEHEYTLAELVHHLLNHSTYHRGQVAVLLRQIGHRPPSTDFRLFLTEARDIGLEV